MADRPKGQRAALRGGIAIVSLAASLALVGCASTVAFDDPTADYLQRTALVSTDGGDAQAANIAMQTPTPWPRHSNDTNIPGNGARIVKAINRYESGAAASATEGATPSAANPGGSTGSGPATGASAGMAASPSSQPSGY